MIKELITILLLPLPTNPLVVKINKFEIKIKNNDLNRTKKCRGLIIS